jgi:hypothetical protein
MSQVSPRARAQLTGAVYAIFFVTAIAGELFTQQAGISGFSVSGDAAATVKSILANQSSFQIGFALSLISIACYVAVTALFYRMFKPVSQSLSLIAAFLSLMGQALALMFLNLTAQVGNIALIFEGVFLLAIGYLIFKSTFLPRLLGALVALAGLAWLTFLAPPLAKDLSPTLRSSELSPRPP